MSGISRRRFLHSSALLGASTMLLSSRARAATARARPRALIQIVMYGGMDAILTTNPKERREVSSKIDVPYEPDEITDANGVRLGPLLSWFREFLPNAAIVNGVIGGTVSHPSGLEMIGQMRRSYPAAPDHGGLVGTVGSLRRGEAPLSAISFGTGATPQPGRTVADAAGLMQALSELARSDHRKAVVLEAIDRELRSCAATGSCVPLETARALIERMPREQLPEIVPLLLPESSDAPKTKNNVPQAWGAVIRDLLFLLRHRLTTGAFVLAPRVGVGWDSHYFNAIIQRECMYYFKAAMQCFLRELRTQRTSDGTLLADEVAIVISSELGRFPIINDFQGKDHFPELPVILLGPGLRPGQYGSTDNNMVSCPISLQTGRPSSSSKDIIPTVDDIGATILNWFGVEDAASVGYVGRRLDFLLS